MICLICNCNIANRQQLASHLKNVHNTNTKEYKSKFKLDKDASLLECPICGEYNFKQLTQHITWKHNLSKEEFLKQFPNTKLWIDSVSERCAKAQAKSIETFKNNLKHNSHYYDEMYVRRNNNRDTKSISNKIRQTRIKNHTNEKMSKRVKLLWQDEDYKKLQSNKAKLQHKNGLTDIIASKSGRKRYLITLGSITYKMRSTWETKLAEYLYKHNIDFKYEPFAIKYMYNNDTHLYYPDFYITTNNIILEVKPNSLCNDDRVVAKKLACEAKGYKFMFITENEMSHLDEINFE